MEKRKRQAEEEAAYQEKQLQIENALQSELKQPSLISSVQDDHELVGEKLIHYAVRRRRITMAISLLRAKANIAVDSLLFDWGPKCGLDTVKALLKGSDIDINSPSRETKLTPLAQSILHMKSIRRRRSKAAREYDTSLFETLLQLPRIDPLMPSPPQAYAPLHIATFANMPLVVDRLLQAKAKSNSVTATNVTCLQIAAHKGHSLVIRKLLARKARVNFTDCRGVTPLFAACSADHHQVRELFLHPPHKRSSCCFYVHRFRVPVGCGTFAARKSKYSNGKWRNAI